MFEKLRNNLDLLMSERRISAGELLDAQMFPQA